MTNITNISPADRFGELMAEKKKLEKEIAALKAILVEGGETVVGDEFTAVFVSPATRWTLDTKAIEAEMGENWVTTHSKISKVSATVRVSKNL